MKIGEAYRIQQEFKITTAAQRTCVESSKEDIRRWLKHATDLGIENVVAARDPGLTLPRCSSTIRNVYSLAGVGRRSIDASTGRRLVSKEQ